MNGLRLSPEETAALLPTFERMDGFVAGAKALAEHMKQLALNEVVASRVPQPPPKQEDSANGT